MRNATFRNVLVVAMLSVTVMSATILSSARLARAADGTWTGTTSGAWLTATNWSGSVIPGSSTTANSDIATFPVATQATAGINMNTTVGTYFLGAIVQNSATRTINNSSTTPGVLTLSGATVTTTVGGGPTNKVILYQNGTGNITVTNGATTGTMGVNLPNAGTSYVVAIDTNFQAVINSIISGPGGLTLMRGGVATTSRFDLGGLNTYEGDTNILSGRIRVRATNGSPHGVGKGNVNVSAGAQFGMDLSNIINGLNGAGIVNNDNSVNITLTLGDGDANGSFSGVIQDPSFATTAFSITKIGGGTQTFSGANTYDGTTTVNAGTLLVNGTHLTGSPYTVAAGATLGGIGTITGPVDLAGILSAGTSAGTLTIGGLTLQNGSSSVFELVNTSGVHAPGAGNDLVDIVGALTGLAATSVTIDVDAIGGGDLSSAGTWTLALYDSLAGTGTPTFNVTGVDPGYTYAVNIVPDDLGAPTGPGSVQLTVVPEPGSIVLVGIAALCIAGRHRRRCATK